MGITCFIVIPKVPRAELGSMCIELRSNSGSYICKTDAYCHFQNSVSLLIQFHLPMYPFLGAALFPFFLMVKCFVANKHMLEAQPSSDGCCVLWRHQN